LDSFRETVKSTPINYFLGNYDLKPGEYVLTIKIFDTNSKLDGYFTRELNLNRFDEQNIRSSHFLFTTSRIYDFSRFQNIVLNFTGKAPDSLFTCLEFATRKTGSLLKIWYKVQDLAEKTLQEGSQSILMDEWKKLVFVPLKVEKMVLGRNNVIIKYEYQGKTYTTNRMFYLNWERSGNGLVDSRITLDQFSLVANPKDYKKIRKAPEEEQDELIAAYWKERDPTPGTPENELFEEFLERIRVANRRFGFSKNDGWSTDRGRIYIKYGPPDLVERDIPSQNAFGRYEVWTYETIKRQFIFYDRNGTGMYRLISY